MTEAARRRPSPRRLLLAAVLAAGALLRLGHFAAVHDEPFFATLAMDSAEYDRWARGLSDPMAGDAFAGEPFFQAPLYPYLLATIYRVAGRSLDAVYLFQIVLGVAALALLARAGERALGRRHGLAAAALGAVYLPFLFHEVQLAKEAIAVPLVALVLERLTAARADGRRSAWLAAGVATGVLALLRENALLVAPLIALLALGGGDPRRARLVRLAVFAAGVLVPLAPVAARNAAAGGGVLPTTWQGGVNFWIGNNPDADGTYRPLTPGRQVPLHERNEARRLAEQALGRELTGAEISRYWLGRSLDWAAAEPVAFLRLQLRKLRLFVSPYEWPDAVDYYWTKRRSPVLALPLAEWGSLLVLAAAGLVLARRRLGELAPALLFAGAWSASAIAFFVFARYRLPVVPPLLLVAAVPLVAVHDAWLGGRRRAAAAGALAIAAVLALPHVAGYPPRTDLVEFNLGRLAEDAGDRAAARRHYEAALAADPQAFLAAMNLGTLAARERRFDEAVARYEQAVAIEPRAVDAWSNLGAARLARGELPAARAALERALELDPRNDAARRNLEILRRLAAEPPR